MDKLNYFPYKNDRIDRFITQIEQLNNEILKCPSERDNLLYRIGFRTFDIERIFEITALFDICSSLNTPFGFSINGSFFNNQEILQKFFEEINNFNAISNFHI